MRTAQSIVILKVSDNASRLLTLVMAVCRFSRIISGKVNKDHKLIIRLNCLNTDKNLRAYIHVKTPSDFSKRARGIRKGRKGP